MFLVHSPIFLMPSATLEIHSLHPITRQTDWIQGVSVADSALDNAIVLATSEEAPPSVVPRGVKFLSLGEGMKPSEAVLSTAA